MIIYSKLEINRIKDFWELLNRLDTETDYMMYEPNERKAKTTIQELKLDIPFSLKIARKLQKKGYQIKDTLDVEELEKQLCQLHAKV